MQGPDNDIRILQYGKNGFFVLGKLTAPIFNNKFVKKIAEYIPTVHCLTLNQGLKALNRHVEDVYTAIMSETVALSPKKWISEFHRLKLYVTKLYQASSNKEESSNAKELVNKVDGIFNELFPEGTGKNIEAKSTYCVLLAEKILQGQKASQGQPLTDAQIVIDFAKWEKDVKDTLEEKNATKMIQAMGRRLLTLEQFQGRGDLLKAFFQQMAKSTPEANDAFAEKCRTYAAEQMEQIKNFSFSKNTPFSEVQEKLFPLQSTMWALSVDPKYSRHMHKEIEKSLKNGNVEWIVTAGKAAVARCWTVYMQSFNIEKFRTQFLAPFLGGPPPLLAMFLAGVKDQLSKSNQDVWKKVLQTPGIPPDVRKEIAPR